MAVVALTVNEIVLTGLECGDGAFEDLVSAANSGGNSIAHDGAGVYFLYAYNNHASGDRTITITSQVEHSQGATLNNAVTVSAQTGQLIGPLAADRFKDEDGNIQVTYSDSGADIKVAALKIYYS